MQKENTWTLLARKLAGEATEEDLRELENILENDAAMKYTAAIFSRLWNALSDAGRKIDRYTSK